MDIFLGKVFVRHKELIKNQYAMMKEVNGNFNEDICTVQINFVENILSSNIKEILSAYMSTKNSDALHPLVYHYTLNV